MLVKLRARLSYANVVATLALFVALGGTSYAATQLARNSVGSSQIRSKAVGSSELRSRAVTSSKIRSRAVPARKLSSSARESLRGPQGAAGPAGPAGPAGVASFSYRAAVDSGGGVAGGNAAATASGRSGTGDYRVAFDRSMAGCVFTATLVRVPGGVTVDPPAGRITAAEDNGRIAVRTFDVDGSPRDLPFHLLAAC